MESAVGSIANKVRSLPCFIPDTSTQQRLILACQFVCCLKTAQRNHEPGEHGRGEKYDGRHGLSLMPGITLARATESLVAKRFHFLDG
jgi:hypothetical protein